MASDISNKTLALLMVIAIVASLGGLFISLERLSQIRIPTITGFATSTGRVNVSVTDNTGLDVTDGLIDFGVCTPPTAGLLIDSNGSNSASCQYESFPDSLTVANIGNTYINVSLKSTLSGGHADFIGGSNASLWFTSRNTSLASSTTTNTGCLNRWTGCNETGVCGCQSEDNCTTTLLWHNITTADTEYIVCRNLSYETNKDNVSVWMRAFVPSDAPVRNNRNNTMIFTAVRVVS